MLRQFDSPSKSRFDIRVSSYMVGQPDVADLDLQMMMGLVSSGGLMSALLPQISTGGDVQVFIGSDDLPHGLNGSASCFRHMALRMS